MPECITFYKLINNAKQNLRYVSAILFEASRGGITCNYKETIGCYLSVDLQPNVMDHVRNGDLSKLFNSKGDANDKAIDDCDNVQGFAGVQEQLLNVEKMLKTIHD